MHFWLHHTGCCAEKIVFAYLRVSGMGGGGGGGGGVGVGHMHMHMHIVAAVKESWLGTGWATSRPQCMDRLKKTLLSP